MVALLIAWFVILGVWSIFSYSLTDHNLTLTSWAGYWSLQNWLWEVFFTNRLLLASTFGIVVVSWFVTYGLLLKKIWERELSIRAVWVILLLSASILLLSYNALSHDVFNYIFNARIVLEYGANPHQAVALDFPYDLWTRFMHNTHTPAPYGYGWTAISLLPGWLGADTFILNWLLFRVVSICSLVLLADVLVRLLKLRKAEKRSFWLAVVVLNPLVLVEVISNTHNDLWMMVPALWSLYLLDRYTSKKMVALSLALLLLSISVKLVTVVLFPVWLLLTLKNFTSIQKYVESKAVQFISRALRKGLQKVGVGSPDQSVVYADGVEREPAAVRTLVAAQGKFLTDTLNAWWPTAAALSLFVPLLTERSTYFHPWYLVWVVVFLPFLQPRVLQLLLIFFSISSLLRYLPWLYVGEYTAEVLQNRVLITWVFPVILWILYRRIRSSAFWQKHVNNRSIQ
jgi:hypothetical protein